LIKKISIEHRKEELEALMQDKQLNDIIRNFLRITILSKEIREDEKEINFLEEMKKNNKIREYVTLQSKKDYILHTQTVFLKNQILQKCGIPVELYGEWSNPKGNALFDIHIANMLKKYNLEKNELNPYLVELLLYSLLNIDLL